MDTTGKSFMFSNHLLYLLYGDKEAYRHEAKFSILSALRHRKNPASFSITVMTDQPQEFKGWPVTVIALDAETLKSWVGTGGYYHRQKACAIQAGAQLAEKTIFIDTDSTFLKDPAELFQRVTDDQFLMDEFEWTWAESCQRPEYHAFAQDLASSSERPTSMLKLYNSGICGMTRANACLMDGAIRLIDQWAHHGHRLMTIEQIAVSFMLHGKKVLEASDCINHYFSVKRFHHAMNKVFFEKHGEAYRGDLPGLSSSVPASLPNNTFADRLRLKWKLKGQGSTSRKVAKFYMLGRKGGHCAYLKACKPIWWAKAVEEMKEIESDRLAMEKLNSLWKADQEFLSFAGFKVSQAE